MSGCRLIVHADDFGLSEAVNEGIVAAHTHGIVTSTSIIASGPAFRHAVELARSLGTLDIGVHLTLTGEEPVSRPQDVGSLLASDGRFHRHTSSFVRRYFAGRICLDEVMRELDAQVARVIASGLSISHLDSHQHVHMVPGVWRVVGRLAARYGVPAVRVPREPLTGYMLRTPGQAGRLMQLCALNAFCAMARGGELRQPEHFRGFFFGGRLTRPNLIRVLETLPGSGTCELMCHPGRHDPTTLHGDWQYQWQDELDALTDPEVANHLLERGIELVSYTAVTRG